MKKVKPNLKCSEQLIKTLLEFNRVHYRRLYLFLDSDERAYPFSCFAAGVDVHFTLKHKNYPKIIYKTLCEHYITAWNLDPQLLLDVILGN